MVVITASGSARAPREHADHVAQIDLVLQPLGGFVGVDVDVLRQVDHRLNAHLGVGVAAPQPHLLGRDRAVDLFDPGKTAGPGHGVVADVDVQDDLALRLAAGLPA